MNLRRRFQPHLRVLGWFWLAFACASILAQSNREPYLLVLGTAQDGGLPQIGCQGPHCLKAHKNPEFKRLVTSLLIVAPASGQRWLIEATPDIRDQVTRMQSHPKSRPLTEGRSAIVDGIFLTHAHLGHYTGLLHLGREAYGHPTVPVYGSRRMMDYLKTNGPWRLLIEAKHIQPTALVPGQGFDLGKGLVVEPLLVPHRDEFSDTFGYVIHGPRKKVLFIPDIDKWSKWKVDIQEWIAKVDIALLDGTFFADGEIPGRAMAEIPHPFIAESLARFKHLPGSERDKIYFIHFNHTNPVVDSASEAAKQVHSHGMHLAEDLQIISL